VSDFFLAGMCLGGIVGLVCGVTFMVALFALGDRFTRRGDGD
jgi:hypothetical protein